MDPELDYLVGIARRWWWLLVLSVAAAAGSAYVVSSPQVSSYEATTTLLVQAGYAPNADPTTNLYAAPMLAQVYLQLATTDVVVRRARAALAGRFSEEQLASGSVSADVKKDSQILRLTARAPTPELAFAMATAMTDSFTTYIRLTQMDRFRSLMQDLEGQITASQARVERVRGELGALDARKGSLSDDDFNREEARLKQQLAAEGDAATRLQESYTSVRIASVLYQTNLVPVDQARSAVPVASPAPRNAWLAGGLALLAVIASVTLVEVIRDRPRSLGAAAAALDLSILGTIPRVKSGRNQSEPARYRAIVLEAREGFRLIRINLRFRGAADRMKSLLVTSVRPEEGKTATVVGLADAFIRDGKCVIIVDADLYRPSQHRIFGLDNHQGLSTMLADARNDPQGLVRLDGQHAGLPKRATFVWDNGLAPLQLLPAGPSSTNPAECLGSAPMRELLERLEAQADIVLVDAPPLLGAADALVLGAAVDGVLLVVDPTTVAMREITAAKQMLQQLGIEALGVVFSKVVRRSSDYYYHYYARSGEKQA